MSSETRTLVVVLLLGGVFASCCVCGSVVALIAVPAIDRVQAAAEEVRARQLAEQQALKRSMPQPRPPVVAPPPLVPPRLRPPPVPVFPEIVLEPPVLPLEDSPPATVPVPPTNSDAVTRPEPPTKLPTKRRRPPANKAQPKGLAALSEMQRRAIYRSVSVSEKMEASMKRQLAEQRQRGFNSQPLEQMLKDRQARRAADLDRLRELHRLSEEEFEQILAEGKEKSW